MPSEGKGKVKMKKILILSANPKDTARLRLDEEVREIEEGLRRSKCRDQFIIQSKWAVRLRDIRRSLLDYEPQIVHFCGYGEEDGLKVEDDVGSAILVRPDALSGLFELFAGQIECILLNACYSAAQAKAINKHINYVIGMSQNVKYKTSIEFAVGFYDALGAGKSVEEAFKFGCNAIQLYNIPGHLNPLLLEKKPVHSQPEDQKNPGRTVGNLPPQPTQNIYIKGGEERKKRIIPIWRIGLYAALVFLIFLSIIYFDKLQLVEGDHEKENLPLQDTTQERNISQKSEKKEEKMLAVKNTNEDSQDDQKRKSNIEETSGKKKLSASKSSLKPGNNLGKIIKEKDDNISQTKNISETCDLPELNNNTSPPQYHTKIITAKACGTSEEEAYSKAREKAAKEFFGRCPSREEYQNAFHRMYCNRLKQNSDKDVCVEVKIEFYEKEEK